MRKTEIQINTESIITYALSILKIEKLIKQKVVKEIFRVLNEGYETNTTTQMVEEKTNENKTIYRELEIIK